MESSVTEKVLLAVNGANCWNSSAGVLEKNCIDGAREERETETHTQVPCMWDP